MNVDRDQNGGVLAPGVRPGLSGWYWCQRAEYSAPECVYFHASAPDVVGREHSRIMTISTGDIEFSGSMYDRDDTYWYGPIGAPLACLAWGKTEIRA